MSRTLSAGMLAAMYAQETDEVPIALLTVTHDDLVDPIYLSSDPTERISDDPLVYATTSRGEEYLFLPFEFTLPDDRTDAPSGVTLTVDNINRDLVALLRSISTPASITLEIVLASSPDDVEIQLPSMLLSNVSIDDLVVQGDLIVDALFNEPFPAGTFTPGAFPGLF